MKCALPGGFYVLWPTDNGLSAPRLPIPSSSSLTADSSFFVSTKSGTEPMEVVGRCTTCRPAIKDANETGGGESVVVGGREEKSGQADNLHFPTIQLTWLQAAQKAHLQRIQIVWQIVSQAQVRIMAE